MMRHLQNIAGRQIHRFPHMGVGVSAQNDLPAMVIEPLAQRAHIHGFCPADEVIAVPLSGVCSVVDLPLPAVQRGLPAENIHFQLWRQLQRDGLRPRNAAKPLNAVRMAL